MDIFKLAERIMRMDDDIWMRHANPWSVWTRFTCLPLIILAVWSRVWLGWWALVPLAAALAWTWANPRIFPAPARTDSWAAMGTYGERVFLNRKLRPVPPHHLRAANILSALSGLGLIPLVRGVWDLDITMTMLGTMTVVLPKVWFVDRMVWLYQDMKARYPDYAAWTR
ncbi:MAG: DUF6653 family protein [Pseudomonadota bacterium]